MKEIVVAGGCFWGVDHYYSLVNGILTTKAVYANSNLPDIGYEQACSGEFNAVEAVYIEYDEAKISLEKIIELLFRIIDPTSKDKQAGDIGVQYRTGIYTNDIADLNLAKEVVASYQNNYDSKIVVEVTELENFYDAEDYHQLYLINNPNGYCHVDFSVLNNEELKKPRKILETKI